MSEKNPNQNDTILREDLEKLVDAIDLFDAITLTEKEKSDLLKQYPLDNTVLGMIDDYLEKGTRPSDTVKPVLAIDHSAPLIQSTDSSTPDPRKVTTHIARGMEDAKANKGKEHVSIFGLKCIDYLASAIPDRVSQLSVGDTIYIDGGSSMFPLWTIFKKQVAKGIYPNSCVYTNNFEILNDWMNNESAIPSGSLTNLGSQFDRDHGNSYGEDLIATLRDHSFKPSAMYIGTTGVEVSEKGEIFLGYHGRYEEQFKKEYFSSSAKLKIVLISPGKLGAVKGMSIDITKRKSIGKAPIVFVSLTPKKETSEWYRFKEMEALMETTQFKQRLLQNKITFVWFKISELLDENNIPTIHSVFCNESDIKEKLDTLISDSRKIVPFASGGK